MKIEKAIFLNSKILVHWQFDLIVFYDPKGDRDDLRPSHVNTLKRRSPFSERREQFPL